MKRLLALFLLAASPALAEQQLSAQDRVAMQIGQLLIKAESLQDQNLALQAELTKAQARIKELEQKPVDKN